jgi:hypothetical protein
VHTRLWQSAPPPQPSPSAHWVEHDPPQSTSVSSPFFLVSPHVASAHAPEVQTFSAQSPAAVQVRPGAQSAQPPAQSMSVSVPFFTPSLQLGCWQTPPSQTPLVQSPGTTQACPGGH